MAEPDPEREPLKTLSSSSPGQVHYVSIPINKNRQLAGSNDFQNFGVGSSDTPTQYHGQGIRRRTSILDQPIGSFKGVNSLNRFATSFQRANSFRAIDIRPDRERSFIDPDGEESYDPNTLGPSYNGRKLSFAITGPGQVSIRPSIADLYGAVSRKNSVIQSSGGFTPSGVLENPIDDSDGLQSVLSNDSTGPYHLPDYSFHDSGNALGPEEDSIVLKQVETRTGKVITVIAGQSTGPQTIFNSINVLIGIGLLALPLGLRHAGWVLGLPLLAIFAFATFCTAQLLSRCLDADPTMTTYGDLAFAAFGPTGRALISFLFTMDLLGCGVALIILFGDSLNALFPEYSVNFFKIVAFFVVTPPAFLPLSVLSNISLLGILSTIGTAIIIVFCGLVKQTAPGSLLQPEPTSLWPKSFKEFCLSLGLLSACWGGHAIFPNLKCDMRHPEKFTSCLKTTYRITIFTDIGIAIVGFLMFGDQVLNEITRSVLLTPGYPPFVYALISVLLSLIPLAKTPLNSRPIVSIFDSMLNVEHIDESLPSSTKLFKNSVRAFNRIAVNAVFVLIAILLPEFDKIIGFLGAALCFTICFILPCLFYKRICHETITPLETHLCNISIAISAVLSIFGVYASLTS